MAKVTTALKTGGAGIFTEIGVQKTPGAKVDIDFHPHRIVDANLSQSVLTKWWPMDFIVRKLGVPNGF